MLTDRVVVSLTLDVVSGTDTKLAIPARIKRGW